MKTVASARIRLLHVDDDADFAGMAAAVLERESDRITVETATSAAEGLDRLAAGGVDCVVSDYDMPGRDGIEFLEAVRADRPDLPFVLFTGRQPEEVAVEALDAGATDYVRKAAGVERYALLANRIANAVDGVRSRRAADRGERCLREVADAVPHLLYVIDEAGTYQLANEALAALHDTTVAAIEGRTVDEILDGSDARAVRADVEEVLASGRPKSAPDVEFVDSAGDRRVFEPRLFPYESDRTVLGIAVDVTDRVERERRIEQVSERLRLALDQTDSVVFDIDLDTDEVTRYGTFERVFDHPSEDLPTWEDLCETLVHPDDRAAFRRFHRELIDGDREGGEIEYRHRTDSETGDPHWRRAAVRVTDRPDGGSRRAIGVSRDVTDDARRELELRRTERRYRAIFDDPNFLIGLTDTDGTVAEVNRTATEYVDVTRETVVGCPLWETPWFDHSEAAQADVREGIERAADGEYADFEVELPCSGTGPHTFEGVFRPVTDDGEVEAVILSARETTDQRRRERERERVNALLSTLFDTMPVGVLAEDADRNVLAANQRFADHLDVPATPDELVGADCERLAAGAAGTFVDPDGFTERIDRLIADGDAVRDEELPLDDGRTFAQSHQPIDLPADDGDGHLWVYRDITEHKAYERRLEALGATTQRLMTAESREEVARIGVEAAREVLDLDANSIHLYDDEREGLVPTARTEVANGFVGDRPVFAGDDGIAWRVYREGESVVLDDVHDEPDVYSSDSPVRSELYLPLGDYGLLLAASPTPGRFDPQDVVLGEILAGSVATAIEQVDRTAELRAREAELTRQNSRLEEFASIVSHDLRNPLNVAEGRLAMAREETDTPHLAPVGRALDRMGTLIDDLLTLAREGEEVSELEAVDLGPLVRDCWETVETAGATLVVEGDRAIQADRSRLRQLFENLIRNAIQHGGDDVTVTVGGCEDGFYVADDGTGIPAAERGTVFDVGYTTSRNGTGFGLNIVERVVDAHGWSVAVVESDGGGARFEITGVVTAVGGTGIAR